MAVPQLRNPTPEGVAEPIWQDTRGKSFHRIRYLHSTVADVTPGPAVPFARAQWQIFTFGHATFQIQDNDSFVCSPRDSHMQGAALLSMRAIYFL